MSSVRIFIRKDYQKKDGRQAIYIRYYDDYHQKKDISTRLSVHCENWDDTNNEVKRGEQYYKEINSRLQYQINRARNIILHEELRGNRLKAKEFGRLFTNLPESNDFLEFAASETKVSAHLFSAGTLKYYRGQISKFKKFRKKIKIHDIDMKFIREYEKYMITELGNMQSTCAKSLSWVKAIINRAKREDIVEKNPFDNIKLSRPNGRREFLSIDELRVLENLTLAKVLEKHELNVLRYFLFSCYTGLRYFDIKNLRYSSIVNGIIRLRMHKTDDEVFIPLIEKARVLIPQYQGFQLAPVFPRVLSNQKTNKCIKAIIRKAGIEKNISFHCARHTFATIGITLGIPLEVLSRLLGHRSVKTTQIYAKIIDEVKIKEMAKWDSI